jgi:hypothetical protein
MSARLLSTKLFVALLVSALISMIVASEVQTVSAEHENVVSDGDYIGLEKMPNLTPEVQGSAWFHENTLVVRNDEAILEKVPVMFLHGKKTYSASDGGFLTYRARFVRQGEQSVIRLRLFESKYAIFPAGKHDEYTEIKTHRVTFVSDQIEFDGVRYKPSKPEGWKLDRLLPLLNIEPLETSDANLPAIAVDSLTVGDYGELAKAVNGLEKASCNGGYHYLEQPKAVGEFVGGRVKTIRVLRTAPFRPGIKPLTLDETRQEVKRVWQGKFKAAFCQIAWAEATFWSVQAVVEFDDGKRSPLITDGVHVALQDHDGNSAFFRLFPAAQ